MGIGGISIWQLLIILVIVLLLFGTKKLSSLGSDLGGAIKGFKKSMADDDEAKKEESAESTEQLDADESVNAGSTDAKQESAENADKQ